jgi:predicted ATPase/DNA-binding SARP family transcriptional activator
VLTTRVCETGLVFSDRRRLSILTLGNIEIRTDSGSVVAALPKSQRRLIGVLASAEGDSVSLGRLIEVLQISKPALQTTVSRIRTAAGDETITTKPNGYALGDVDLDTIRFRDLVAAAADMLPHDRETRLREALGLWRGDPFAEFTEEDWARTAAVRLHELHAAAIEDHAEALLDIGRAGESAALMRAHTEIHPLRDRPVVILMRALASQGRGTEALRVAREHRRHLGDEFGTEPSSAFTEIERSIASGEHREIVESSPTNATPITNLGGEPNGFVDRPETDEIATLLESCRLVTLVGPGGIGKSRCATAVARRFIDRPMSGGIWFADLSPAHDQPNDVAAILARTIGVQRQAGMDLTETIAKFLQHRRTMLVVDNCEHVVASARELVTALIERCPDLVVLATSRLRMQSPLERVVEIAPMAPASAIELFEARVAECGAGPFDREQIATLCAHLDNYPLALELTAGRTRVLSPAEIHNDLLARPGAMPSNPAAASTRHKTLDAALAWSLDQLDAPTAAILSSLAVFRGSFDFASAQAILTAETETDERDVLRALEALVQHHLLHRDHATARFRLLEPVRQHLIGKRPIDAHLAERHARFFADFTREVIRGKFTSDEARCQRSFRLSLPDVRAAVDWAIDHRESALVESMMERMAMIVSAEIFIEGSDWAERALDAFDADAADMPSTALAAAMGRFWLERFDESTRLLDRVESTAGDPVVLGVLAMVRTNQAVFTGDFPSAVSWGRRCAEVGRAIGDATFELQALLTEMDPRAVEMADRLGCPSRSAVARWFAWLSLDVEARGRSTLPDAALDLAFESGDPYCIAQGLSFLASRLLRAGDVAQGAGELANALERMLRFRAPTLVWAGVDQVASALAIIAGHEDAAVTLWAALETAGRASTGQSYMVAGTVEAARAALSADELNEASAHGSTLTMDTAALFALERLEKIAIG